MPTRRRGKGRGDGGGKKREVRPASEHHSREPKCFLVAITSNKHFLWQQIRPAQHSGGTLDKPSPQNCLRSDILRKSGVDRSRECDSKSHRPYPAFIPTCQQRKAPYTCGNVRCGVCMFVSSVGLRQNCQMDVHETSKGGKNPLN
ncbi:unnamed protein product [Pleuronectes platessa]|uniref:Uncharacterized protein n=1 Tax=Pleuronectes platessa TaxID=8262 RepID=A0A9N7TXV0_PLEPL|nr:unnamed protein product [Pleuronectes platessa]